MRRAGIKLFLIFYALDKPLDLQILHLPTGILFLVHLALQFHFLSHLLLDDLWIFDLRDLAAVIHEHLIPALALAAVYVARSMAAALDNAPGSADPTRHHLSRRVVVCRSFVLGIKQDRGSEDHREQDYTSFHHKYLRKWLANPSFDVGIQRGVVTGKPVTLNQFSCNPRCSTRHICKNGEIVIGQRRKILFPLRQFLGIASGFPMTRFPDAPMSLLKHQFEIDEPNLVIRHTRDFAETGFKIKPSGASLSVKRVKTYCIGWPGPGHRFRFLE
jgi:hypothetical protein